MSLAMARSPDPKRDQFITLECRPYDRPIGLQAGGIVSRSVPASFRMCFVVTKPAHPTTRMVNRRNQVSCASFFHLDSGKS